MVHPLSILKIKKITKMKKNKTPIVFHNDSILDKIITIMIKNKLVIYLDHYVVYKGKDGVYRFKKMKAVSVDLVQRRKGMKTTIIINKKKSEFIKAYRYLRCAKKRVLLENIKKMNKFQSETLRNIKMF